MKFVFPPFVGEFFLKNHIQLDLKIVFLSLISLATLLPFLDLTTFDFTAAGRHWATITQPLKSLNSDPCSNVHFSRNEETYPSRNILARITVYLS